MTPGRLAYDAYQRAKKPIFVGEHLHEPLPWNELPTDTQDLWASVALETFEGMLGMDELPQLRELHPVDWVIWIELLVKLYERVQDGPLRGRGFALAITKLEEAAHWVRHAELALAKKATKTLTA